MEYTKTFNLLKDLFNQEQAEIHISNSAIKIYNVPFYSDLPGNGFSSNCDNQISENFNFSYPVFSPPDTKSNKAIILFHGLNERSWVKYLAWAYWLAENTDSYIILFPMSFHINRSPAMWRDPRIMGDFMRSRKSEIANICMSSFANVALSARLTEDPLRFFNSGYQTVVDIKKLLFSIKSGQHPLIKADCKINIFAYSIGAFLAEILVMGNPDNLFDNSKLFIFCGGSVFSNMKGSSKLIMDNMAYEKLYNFYLNDFEERITGNNPFSDLLLSTQIGMSFRSMIDLGRFKTFREDLLKKLKHQIHTITLLKDTVIPSKGVVATLGSFINREQVEVWDFNYPYSHENPFPLYNSPFNASVDRSFENVFQKAKNFFT